ncbi:MAG: dihydrolipoamide acetyltransferase family protein [Deferrisomatales bacterium]
MPYDVTMPKLTDSMEEGRIVEWKVAPGDRVREGDVLAEIETDKAVMELESFWSGTVAELLRPDGEVVAVGEVIARIAEAGGEPRAPAAEEGPPPTGAAEAVGSGAKAPGTKAAPEEDRSEKEPPVPAEEDHPVPPERPARRAGEEAAPPGGEIPLPGAHPLSERGGAESPRPAAPPRPAPTPVPGPGVAKAGVRASPRARKLAREKGVDLSRVTGTGPEGRVMTADVEAAAAGRGPPLGPAAEGKGEGSAEGSPLRFAEGEAEVRDVGFFQKAAIRRVTESARTVPCFFVSAGVRADPLLASKEAAGEGVTLTHLLLRASALTLGEIPEANRSYDRGRWVQWNVVNLGLAVQTEAGLVVAVLRGAQGRGLPWIAERTGDLVARARAGRLRPEERANATFTVSNLGAFGVERFTAIPNPPSALTLAVGAVADAPLVQGGRVEVGRRMHLTLSCDHRVVDGVLAARFLGALRGRLEEPEEL